MHNTFLPGLRNGPMSWRQGVAAAVAVLGFCCTPQQAHAVVINSTVTPGDVFTVNNQMTLLSQIENGVRAGGTVTYGNANEQLGGIFADATGLYLAGNPNGAGLTVERIALGQTTSTPLLGPTDFVGAGGAVLRDLNVLASGTIYTLYTNGAVDRFTPTGIGGYLRTPVGTFTNFTGADRGSGHQLSVSLNGNFLLTSSRTQNSAWSMNLATGAVQQWITPALTGPVTNAQLVPSATSVLDPVRGDRLLLPMGNDGLYEVAFDQTTGAFPNVNPFRLSNDTVAAFVDGLGFDAEGDLNLSLRDDGTIGSLREFTQSELALASAGTAFSIFGKPAYYTGTDARIARDLFVVVPEPSVAALLIGAAACFGRHRRRSA